MLAFFVPPPPPSLLFFNVEDRPPEGVNGLWRWVGEGVLEVEDFALDHL